MQLHGVYEDEQCVELVMSLCTGGDLWSRIRRGVYSEREAARVIADVLRAVAQVTHPELAGTQPTEQLWHPWANDSILFVHMCSAMHVVLSCEMSSQRTFSS